MCMQNTLIILATMMKRNAAPRDGVQPLCLSPSPPSCLAAMIQLVRSSCNHVDFLHCWDFFWLKSTMYDVTAVSISLINSMWYKFGRSRVNAETQGRRAQWQLETVWLLQVRKSRYLLDLAFAYPGYSYEGWTIHPKYAVFLMNVHHGLIIIWYLQYHSVLCLYRLVNVC